MMQEEVHLSSGQEMKHTVDFVGRRLAQCHGVVCDIVSQQRGEVCFMTHLYSLITAKISLRYGCLSKCNAIIMMDRAIF
jgi:hypothetical protein